MAFLKPGLGKMDQILFSLLVLVYFLEDSSWEFETNKQTKKKNTVFRCLFEIRIMTALNLLVSTVKPILLGSGVL